MHNIFIPFIQNYNVFTVHVYLTHMFAHKLSMDVLELVTLLKVQWIVLTHTEYL